MHLHKHSFWEHRNIGHLKEEVKKKRGREEETQQITPPNKLGQRNFSMENKGLVL